MKLMFKIKHALDYISGNDPILIQI